MENKLKLTELENKKLKETSKLQIFSIEKGTI